MDNGICRKSGLNLFRRKTMAEKIVKKSLIDWCGRTWELTEGCTRVDPCCENCYAEYHVATRGKHRHPGIATYTPEKGARWTGEVRARPQALGDWKTWGKAPELVFVCSRSDLFHDKIDPGYIFQVFAEFAAARDCGHTFIVLTKRIERAARILPGIYNLLRELGIYAPAVYGQPLPNVWVGTTIGTADKVASRCAALEETPAVVKWISAEPLLEDISEELGHVTLPDWIVTGGETARPMSLARKTPEGGFIKLRNVCERALIPFYFKQWGNWGADGIQRSKAENGHILDGKEYRAYPTVYGQPDWNHYFPIRYQLKSRLAQISE